MAKGPVGFKWVKTPTQMGKRIDEYGEKILVAVQAVAAYVGQQMQNQARAHAPWQDRTGNARSGLLFAVDGFGLAPIVGQVSGQVLSQNTDSCAISGDKDHLVIALGHTVFYGRYLETIAGGHYAVIMSTIEGNLGTLERMLHNLLK